MTSGGKKEREKEGEECLCSFCCCYFFIFLDFDFFALCPTERNVKKKKKSPRVGVQ